MIQLPKGEDKYSYNDYLDRKRNYDRDPITAVASENDYIDDVEDYESKVVNINNKKVRIKVSVNIFISSCCHNFVDTLTTDC